MTPTNHKRKILHDILKNDNTYNIYDAYSSDILGEEGEVICYSLTKKNYNELWILSKKIAIKFIRKNDTNES